MLFVILENIRPDAIVVALDAPGKTFRHAEYSEYKGTRREIQPELKVQLPIAPGPDQCSRYSADRGDWLRGRRRIGTISKLAEENGYDTTIVTGDLDALQLIDECVSVVTPKTGVTETATYDVAAVQARYGFGPEFIPDFKAIKGDTSDNIPGVPGIGDKGGSELICMFGTIEDLLANFDKVPPKYAKKIEDVKEQLVKSKWLATIKRDVPLEYDFKPFVLTSEQIEVAQALLESMEMRSVAKRAPLVLGRYLDGAAPASEATFLEAREAALKSERIEVTVEQVRSWDEMVRFVDGKHYAALWSTPPRRTYSTSRSRPALSLWAHALPSARQKSPQNWCRNCPAWPFFTTARSFISRWRRSLAIPGSIRCWQGTCCSRAGHPTLYQTWCRAISISRRLLSPQRWQVRYISSKRSCATG